MTPLYQHLNYRDNRQVVALHHPTEDSDVLSADDDQGNDSKYDEARHMHLQSVTLYSLTLLVTLKTKKNIGTRDSDN